jgi:hypothetical protein
MELWNPTRTARKASAFVKDGDWCALSQTWIVGALFFKRHGLWFIHFVACLTTGPQHPPKWVLHRLRSNASFFNFQHPLVSPRSSSICLRLLPLIKTHCLQILTTKICSNGLKSRIHAQSDLSETFNTCNGASNIVLVLLNRYNLTAGEKCNSL